MFPFTQNLKDGTTVTIRKATGADAELVLEYVEAISLESNFLTFGPGEFGITLEEERAYFDSLLKMGNALFLLAFVESQLVASINFSGGVRPRIRHVGEMGVSVRESHCGKGIAGLLIDLLVEWAKQGGVVRKINLKVRTDNHRAIELYQRKGFEIEGTVKADFALGETYYDQHCMGLVVVGSSN
ncbi:MAG: GNAT family N-acetyltransferase [Planctomycetaceae bacterium]|nr:GNAT family N-acetyltransferase [Planctomycetaceae bacterium]